MTLPGFQDFMLPSLQVFADGQEHSNSEVFEAVAGKLALSEADLAIRISTGSRTKAEDRTLWSLVYMTQAGLLESTGRGLRKITKQGTELLAKNPDRIDNQLLRNYAEFRDFEARSRKSKSSDDGTLSSETEEDQLTPEEELQAAFERVQEPRREELLESILKKSPEFFERLVLEVLTAAGYGGAADGSKEHLGKSGDGGVDGVIKEDALGLELIYVQAKRYSPDNSVGRREIQQFAGSLEGFRARKGVFITTSAFTAEAKEYAAHIEKRIALIDGTRLIDLMLEHDVGVRTIRTYALKAIDIDYFENL